MEENLIEEVKEHKALYIKGCIDFRNKKKRAEAWDSISKSLNISVSSCQARWKTLRDRFVKEYNKCCLTSGSDDTIQESQWTYFKKMLFLREHITTRKKERKTLPVIDNEGSSSNEELPTTSHSTRSRKRNADSDDFDDFFRNMSGIAEKRFRPQNNDAHTSKNEDKHKAFFLMVTDLFSKIPDNIVDDCKIFYINYLYDQIKNGIFKLN